MRISDWSSDVCSSDLVSPGAGPTLSAIWLAPRFSYSCPLLHRKSRLCRSEEHTSELQSLMRISYAVLCLKKKNTILLTIARTLFEYLIHEARPLWELITCN